MEKKFDIDELIAFCIEMNRSNKANDKKVVLSKYPQMKDILLEIYDPLTTYGVSSSNIKKRQKAQSNPTKRQKTSENTFCEKSYENIFELLEQLKLRQLTGHQALDVCLNFVAKYEPKQQEYLWKIFDKDLKIGVQPKTINAVFPGLIPQFQVILAEKYEQFQKKVDFEKDEWFCSRKLDGLRCVVVIDSNGKIDFYSRVGNPFTGLSNLVPKFSVLNIRSMVFDGELCIVDQNGNENFQECVSQMRRKNHTIEHPVFFAFDCITYDEFFEGKSNNKFDIRQKNLAEKLSGADSSYIKILAHHIIENEENFLKRSDEASENKWEGLIIRKNIAYEAKRSSNVLKVKKFNDDEFVVKKILTGKITVVENGKKIQLETLSSVIVDYGGDEVGVGSGFSLEDRKKIFACPESIIGKKITVQYFESTENKKGGKSMRFPTVKTIWWEERDV